MTRGLGVLVNVDIWIKIYRLGGQELQSRFNAIYRPSGRSVNFDAIAGCQQDHFIKVAKQLQIARKIDKFVALHRELLANFHRRGLVTDSDDEKFHINSSKQMRR